MIGRAGRASEPSPSRGSNAGPEEAGGCSWVRFQFFLDSRSQPGHTGFTANGNGRLEIIEATGLAYPQNFDRYDLNADDTLTGAEINAETPRPTIVYSSELTITLGGSSVELMHPGPAHSDDMSVLYFPEECAVFAVDFLHVKRFPVYDARRVTLITETYALLTGL